MKIYLTYLVLVIDSIFGVMVPIRLVEAKTLAVVIATKVIEPLAAIDRVRCSYLSVSAIGIVEQKKSKQ